MKVIDTRRSVRSFKNLNVDDKDILKILKAAMQAPSARNQQPWEFLVVKDVNKKQLISEKLKNVHMAKNCDFLIVFLTNKLNLITPMMYPQDLSASITCAMLEARSLKIGSCWCGIFPNEERMSAVRDVFEINDEILEPFAVVCFGYPESDEAFKKINRYKNEKIHYEKIHIEKIHKEL